MGRRLKRERGKRVGKGHLPRKKEVVDREERAFSSVQLEPGRVKGGKEVGVFASVP